MTEHLTEPLPRSPGRRPWLGTLLLVLLPLSILVAFVVLVSMSTAGASGGCGGG
jgi:hypothetical protein